MRMRSCFYAVVYLEEGERCTIRVEYDTGTLETTVILSKK